MRVNEYTVTTVRGEIGDFLLITTIWDPADAPAQDLAEAYAQCWEIELCFGELKTHQRGPSLVLRSKTPDGVLQEIYGYLCVHYALRSLSGEVARDLARTPCAFPSRGPSGPHGEHWLRARLFSPKKHAAAFVVFCRKFCPAFCRLAGNAAIHAS
ncbi:hypothetical protein ADIAG_01089 [Paeniglutamicibacter gangotriensis Lz1y]|uniref:Transposase n=1 Tax=Paeniglutamicibacter gangotriensis Lz1y TaxID=1276920 RepID=M7MYF9_9MICC|nr:hypothetical protein ADIAG_01089 [Paeniglutamicibacter gangotriensis Lz1y]